MSKIKNALNAIADALRDLANDPSFEAPKTPEKKVVVLSKRDAKIIELMEEASKGRGGGGVLVKSTNNADGFSVVPLANMDSVKKFIEAVKAGEVELA